MLDLQNVAKTFNPGTVNEVRSLRGVNLDLAAGSWVIIIGTKRLGKIHTAERRGRNFFRGRRPHPPGGTRRDAMARARARHNDRTRFQNPFSGTFRPGLTIQENLSLAARRGRRRGLGWGFEGNRWWPECVTRSLA